jgi:hypothetical protein
MLFRGVYNMVKNKLNLPYIAAGAVLILIVVIVIGGSSITGNAVAATCTDSEFSPPSRYEYGVVTFKEDGVTHTFRDECRDSDTVIEHSCSSPLRHKQIDVDCMRGETCQNGYCIK